MLIAWIALGLSAVGTATAIYAAVLAHRSNTNSESALQWQKARDQPSIRIEFTHAAQTHAGFIGPNDPRPLPKYYELTVNIVNDGETVEQLRELVIETADRTERLPLELRPRANQRSNHTCAIQSRSPSRRSRNPLPGTSLWRACGEAPTSSPASSNCIPRSWTPLTTTIGEQGIDLADGFVLVGSTRRLTSRLSYL